MMISVDPEHPIARHNAVNKQKIRHGRNECIEDSLG